jgi:hypothetical protein
MSRRSSSKIMITLPTAMRPDRNHLIRTTNNKKKRLEFNAKHNTHYSRTHLHFNVMLSTRSFTASTKTLRRYFVLSKKFQILIKQMSVKRLLNSTRYRNLKNKIEKDCDILLLFLKYRPCRKSLEYLNLTLTLLMWRIW